MMSPQLHSSVRLQPAMMPLSRIDVAPAHEGQSLKEEGEIHITSDEKMDETQNIGGNKVMSTGLNMSKMTISEKSEDNHNIEEVKEMTKDFAENTTCHGWHA